MDTVCCLPNIYSPFLLPYGTPIFYKYSPHAHGISCINLHGVPLRAVTGTGVSMWLNVPNHTKGKDLSSRKWEHVAPVATGSHLATVRGTSWKSVESLRRWKGSIKEHSYCSLIFPKEETILNPVNYTNSHNISYLLLTFFSLWTILKTENITIALIFSISSKS